MLGLCKGLYYAAWVSQNGRDEQKLGPQTRANVYDSGAYINRYSIWSRNDGCFPSHRAYYLSLDRCPLRMS